MPLYFTRSLSRDYLSQWVCVKDEKGEGTRKTRAGRKTHLFFCFPSLQRSCISLSKAREDDPQV